MTGPSVTYYTNPRFVPDDIRLRFGGSDDAALVYDATNDELTIQTTNLAGTLIDRVRFQANLDSPAVDMTGMRVNNLLAGLDDGSAASPALSFDADIDSGIYRIGADIVGVAVNGAEVARFGTAGERLGDNIKSLYGSGDDAAVYYDGTDLVIDPAEVGSGDVKISGTIRTTADSVTEANEVLGAPANDQGVIRKFIHKGGLADATATSVFKIDTTDESGANDAGGYHVIVRGFAGHRVSFAGNGGAVMGFGAHFSRYMGTTAGLLSAVTEDYQDAVAGNDLGLRTIIGVVMTVTEVSEYQVDIQFSIDIGGSAASTGEISLEVTLIYDEFLTPPVITAL